MDKLDKQEKLAEQRIMEVTKIADFKVEDTGIHKPSTIPKLTE